MDNFSKSQARHVIESAIKKFYLCYRNTPKVKVVFKQVMATKLVFYPNSNGESRLQFGFELLEWFWNNGLKCRPKLAASPSTFGPEAIHLVVLHELAHLLQDLSLTPEQLMSEKPHSRIFYRFYRELKQRLPYAPAREVSNPVIASARQQLSQMFAIKADTQK